MGHRRNIRLLLEYDGTRYHGWQRQKNALTLQEVLETALARLTGEEVRVIASGRTDAGVHALGQVVNFLTESHLPLRAFCQGLNSLLPRDIAVLRAEEAPPDFHARYHASWKTYEYRLLNRAVRSPLNEAYTWQIGVSLDLEAMREACRLLVGEHDFSAFRAAGGRAGSGRRVVREAILERAGGERLRFTITANGFLRGMVRSLVGTLVEIGKGKYSLTRLREALRTGDRGLCGPTAPPQGLFLVRVEYPEHVNPGSSFSQGAEPPGQVAADSPSSDRRNRKPGFASRLGE